MRSSVQESNIERKSGEPKSIFEIVQKPYFRLFIVVLASILVLVSVVDFAFPGTLIPKRSLRDFDAFYISGLIFLDGNLASAYNYEYLFPYQHQFSETSDSMPWTYPLHFNLVTGFLGLFPIWVAYLLFIIPTLLGFFWVIRKLAGEYAVFVVLLLFPMLIVCIRSGQSSLLIAFLVGLFAYQYMHRARNAWVPLVFLTFKPHFMVGVVLFLMVKRQWRTLILSACATSVMLLLVTLLGGFEIWPAFFGAVDESSNLLAQGQYKLRRMFSHYAMFRSMDVSAGIAMIIQSLGGVAWLAVAGYAMYRKWCLRHVLATVIFASIFLSPYAYDYDFLVFGVGMALLMPEFAKRASNAEGLSMIVLSYTGFVVSLLKFDLPSFGAIVATVLCVMSLRIARRTASKGSPDITADTRLSEQP